MALEEVVRRTVFLVPLLPTHVAVEAVVVRRQALLDVRTLEMARWRGRMLRTAQPIREAVVAVQEVTDLQTVTMMVAMAVQALSSSAIPQHQLPTTPVAQRQRHLERIRSARSLRMGRLRWAHSIHYLLPIHLSSQLYV